MVAYIVTFFTSHCFLIASLVFELNSTFLNVRLLQMTTNSYSVLHNMTTLISISFFLFRLIDIMQIIDAHTVKFLEGICEKEKRIYFSFYRVIMVSDFTSMEIQLENDFQFQGLFNHRIELRTIPAFTIKHIKFTHERSGKYPRIHLAKMYPEYSQIEFNLESFFNK